MIGTKLSVFVCLILAILCIHSTSAQDRVRSLEKQCTDRGFAGVCRRSTRNPTGRNRCSQTLQCAVRVGAQIFSQPGGSIPDGTSCGRNKICRRRRCVTTQRMPTVIGGSRSLTCRGVVSRANRITPREPSPI